MEKREFRNQLARMRFIDRDDLPATKYWDEDWPSFRDNPFRYLLRCSDQHEDDIWQALERDRTMPPMERARERAKRIAEAVGGSLCSWTEAVMSAKPDEMSSLCERCGAEVPFDDSICERCGTEVPCW